jgi:inner membrane protein
VPTIITHAALPLIAAWGVGKRIPAGLALAGAGAAMLPDADVVGFLLGIPYDAPLGHRGASHSFILPCCLD